MPLIPEDDAKTESLYDDIKFKNIYLDLFYLEYLFILNISFQITFISVYVSVYYIFKAHIPSRHQTSM